MFDDGRMLEWSQCGPRGTDQGDVWRKSLGLLTLIFMIGCTGSKPNDSRKTVTVTLLAPDHDMREGDLNLRWDGDMIVQDAILQRDPFGADLTNVSMRLEVDYREDILGPKSKQKQTWSKTFSFASWSPGENKTITMPAAPLLISYSINGTGHNKESSVPIHDPAIWTRSSAGTVPTGVTYFAIDSISDVGAAEMVVRLKRSDNHGALVEHDWGRSEFLVTCQRKADATLEQHRFVWPSWEKKGSVVLTLPRAEYERIEFKGIVEETPNGSGRKRVVNQAFAWKTQ
jgi:hypothetical protein